MKNKPGKVIMYQVYVEDQELGHEIPIGPMMDVHDALLGLVERVNVGVSRGELKGWRNAYIKTLDPTGERELIVR